MSRVQMIPCGSGAAIDLLIDGATPHAVADIRAELPAECLCDGGESGPMSMMPANAAQRSIAATCASTSVAPVRPKPTGSR